VKNIFFLSFIGILFCTQSGCTQAPKRFDAMLQSLYRHTVPQVNAQQLSLDLQKDTSILILDTREIAEYAVSHIVKAKCAGYRDFDKKMIENLPKNHKIIVYCSVGYRSERVGERLKKMGFTNVYNLYGGIFDWVNQKNVVVDNAEQPVQKVHTYNKKWSKWVNEGCEKVY
jgi:rhodanese-related sulfurtransferase